MKNVKIKKLIAVSLFLVFLLTATSCQLIRKISSREDNFFKFPVLSTSTSTDMSEIITLSQRSFPSSDALYLPNQNWSMTSQTKTGTVEIRSTFLESGNATLVRHYSITLPEQNEQVLMNEENFLTGIKPLVELISSLYQNSSEDLLSLIQLSRKEGLSDYSLFPNYSSYNLLDKETIKEKERVVKLAREIALQGEISQIYQEDNPTQDSYAEKLTLTIAVDVTKQMNQEKLNANDFDLKLANAEFALLEKASGIKPTLTTVKSTLQEEAKGLYEVKLTRYAKGELDSNKIAMAIEFTFSPFDSPAPIGEESKPKTSVKTFGSEEAARKAFYQSFMSQIPESIRSEVTGLTEETVEQLIEGTYKGNEILETTVLNAETAPYELNFTYNANPFLGNGTISTFNFHCTVDSNGNLIQ